MASWLIRFHVNIEKTFCENMILKFVISKYKAYLCKNYLFVTLQGEGHFI